MAGHVLNVQAGMDVFDNAGQRLGRVAEVSDGSIPPAAAAGTVPSTGEYEATPGNAMTEGEESGGAVLGRSSLPPAGDASASSTAYLKLEDGGFLGIGGKELWIPFDLVDTVVPGASVTVNATRDELRDRYTEPPR